mmetsp:Transcript_42535/g.77229  ORF Transcript_42535/g.77229 Transcript_42535/m.77229 type:complete len:307 (-) Transcript_42535:51-971(-)
MVFGSAEMVAHQASVTADDFKKQRWMVCAHSPSESTRSHSSTSTDFRKSTSSLRSSKKKMRATFGSNAELRGMFDEKQQITSNLKGAPKYSFGPGYGKPRHLKGRFHLEVLDRRHKEYTASNDTGPGVGAYHLQTAVGRHGPALHNLPAHRELAEKHGHPEYKRAPGYMFSASTEVRDRSVKRYTTLSHVRGESNSDVPGPGRYTGSHEQSRFLKKDPSYSLRPKCGYHRQDETPAPGEYDVSIQMELGQQRPPSWKFTAQQRAFEAIEESYGPGRSQHRYTEHMGTPDELGPGFYKHMTSIHSQF